MKLLNAQYLSNLAKSFQKLVLGLMMVMPLLAVSPTSRAAEQAYVEFSQAELDQMLAPIALYPDALLSQVLIASTYPLEVIQADRWVRSNKDLKAEDALKFAENKNWDPSVKSLVAFPDILKRMSEDVDWTQRLGDAFLSNEGDVMDAVQRLRKRAYATGNLEKAQHISVERDDNYITIEPAEERIVYVPVYDTRVVYGNWWWPEYPPIYWNYPSHYTYTSGFYWGSSIFVGSSYFYSSPRWRDRCVVVIDRNRNYNTHFYTGRSIVRHDSARNWTHNPDHRQGVAYYNNRLRDTYHSPRPSYQNDRQYREQHREQSRGNRNDNNNHGITRNNDGNGRYEPRSQNNGNSNARPFDRSEQVRVRLNNTNNNGTVNNTNNRELRPWQHSNNNHEVNRSTQGTNIATVSEPSSTEAPNDRQRGRVRADDNNASSPHRVNQEQRVFTDNSDRRAVLTRPIGNETQQPQITGPIQETPRFSQPKSESQGNRQSERTNDSPRFSRHKKDDNN